MKLSRGSSRAHWSERARWKRLQRFREKIPFPSRPVWRKKLLIPEMEIIFYLNIIIFSRRCNWIRTWEPNRWRSFKSGWFIRIQASCDQCKRKYCYFAAKTSLQILWKTRFIYPKISTTWCFHNRGLPPISNWWRLFFHWKSFRQNWRFWWSLCWKHIC